MHRMMYRVCVCLCAQCMRVNSKVLICIYQSVAWTGCLCCAESKPPIIAPFIRFPSLPCLQGPWDRLNSNQMLWLLPCTVHPCKSSPYPLSSTLMCFPHTCYFPFIPCNWITPCSTLKWIKMLGQHRGCTWGGFGVPERCNGKIITVWFLPFDDVSWVLQSIKVVPDCRVIEHWGYVDTSSVYSLSPQWKAGSYSISKWCVQWHINESTIHLHGYSFLLLVHISHHVTK